MEQVVGLLNTVSDIVFAKKGQAEQVSKEVVKEVKTFLGPREMAGSGFVRFAGLSGAIAVSMAAYGAHG